MAETAEIVASAENLTVPVGTGTTTLSYTYLDDGTVEISDCGTSAAGELEIPAEIDGVTVTSIGSSAFYRCTSLTSITIPDSVTSIGSYAFSYCISLITVTIGDSVTSIGRCAFYDCVSLTSVTIGDGVTSIGSDAFSNCTSLTSVTIPDSVTSIGSYAFQYSGLTSATIPDSVTSIGDWAFDNCTGLTDVYYTGTEDEWNEIAIGSYNTCLTSATIYFSETPSATTTEPTTTVTELTTTTTETYTTVTITTESEVTTTTTTTKLTDITVEKNADVGYYFSGDTREFITDLGLATVNGSTDGVTLVDANGKAYVTPTNLYAVNGETYCAINLYVAYNGKIVDDDIFITIYVGKKGDSDLDGEVTIIDASCTLVYYANIATGNTTSFSTLTGNDISLETLMYFLSDIDTESTAGRNTDDGTITMNEAWGILLRYAGDATGNSVTWDDIIDDCTYTTGSGVITIGTGEVGIDDLKANDYQYEVEIPVTSSGYGAMLAFGLSLGEALSLDGKGYSTDAAVSTIPEGSDMYWFALIDNAGYAGYATLNLTLTVPEDVAVGDTFAITGQLTAPDGSPAIIDGETAAEIVSGSVTVVEGGSSTSAVTTTADDTTDTESADADATEESAKGDVDDDNAITITDAALCLQAYANAAAGNDDGLTDAQRKAADVDGDGVITINDASYILQYYANTAAGNAVTWEDILGRA